MQSGIYYDLLNKGFIKSEDEEPGITGFEFFYDAFRELSTTRQSGFNIGPIPFTAIADYFTIYNIDGDFFDFSSVIRRMDEAYLDMNAEDMKNRNKADSGKGSNKSGTAANSKKDSN